MTRTMFAPVHPRTERTIEVTCARCGAQIVFNIALIPRISMCAECTRSSGLLCETIGAAAALGAFGPDASPLDMPWTHVELDEDEPCSEVPDDLASLRDDTAGITCSDRDHRYDEPTLPDFELHDTEPCPAPVPEDSHV